VVSRTIIFASVAALLALGMSQAFDAFQLRGLHSRENDVNSVQAARIAHIAQSLVVPVAFAREVLDSRNSRNGRKPKIVIDPDGRGSVVGAQVGSLGFELYREGRPPALISRYALHGEDAQVADVDGDGAPDIVVGGLDAVTMILHNPLHRGCSNVYRCTWPMTVVDSRHSSHDVVLGDVNRSGRVDIATESGIYFNERSGNRWQFVGGNMIRRDGEGTSLIDAQHDGILDVIAPYRSGTMLARFINPLHHGADPTRNVWDVDVIDAHPPFTGNMTTAVADVDRDGRNDVLLAPMYGGGGLYWYQAPRTQSGHWRRHLIDKTVNFVHQGSLQIADMNGNGRPDVAFAEQDQSPTRRVGVFYNVGGKSSRWRLQVLGVLGGHNIKVGRLGRDCRPSIVSARHGFTGGPNPLVVWRNLSRQVPSTAGRTITAPAVVNCATSPLARVSR
jgi:hypothetical protein